MMGQMLQWDRNGDGKLSPNEVPRECAGHDAGRRPEW